MGLESLNKDQLDKLKLIHATKDKNFFNFDDLGTNNYIVQTLLKEDYLVVEALCDLINNDKLSKVYNSPYLLKDYVELLKDAFNNKDHDPKIISWNDTPKQETHVVFNLTIFVLKDNYDAKYIKAATKLVAKAKDYMISVEVSNLIKKYPMFCYDEKNIDLLNPLIKEYNNFIDSSYLRIKRYKKGCISHYEHILGFIRHLQKKYDEMEMIRTLMDNSIDDFEKHLSVNVINNQDDEHEYDYIDVFDGYSAYQNALKEKEETAQKALKDEEEKVARRKRLSI